MSSLSYVVVGFISAAFLVAAYKYRSYLLGKIDEQKIDVDRLGKLEDTIVKNEQEKRDEDVKDSKEFAAHPDADSALHELSLGFPSNKP